MKKVAMALFAGALSLGLISLAVASLSALETHPYYGMAGLVICASILWYCLTD